MMGAAKLAGAIVLYLPALIWDVLMFAGVNVLNALFWAFWGSLIAFDIGVLAFFVTMCLTPEWSDFEPTTAKQLEKWAGA